MRGIGVNKIIFAVTSALALFLAGAVLIIAETQKGAASGERGI